ncbi:hypothetical protein COCNU_01G010840 [Cocos nucifera]|uniref:glycerophosphodiester phosphodiesterase n=1 Tax=Cocos nucifera TaxID=13894 RepID=A0A8K0HV74_COCNU|nr:hypothetical protein COCNU_01G010840 [Cocos nucifera]
MCTTAAAANLPMDGREGCSDSPSQKRDRKTLSGEVAKPGNQLAAKPAAADPANAKPAAAKPQAAKWKALSGNAPLVIARGGFSGIFPESSQFALATSLKETVLLCDLQWTKDGAGICLSDLKLDNSTTISTVFPKRDMSYSVNGQSLKGWFSVDFTIDELISNVTNQTLFLMRALLLSGLSHLRTEALLFFDAFSFENEGTPFLGAFSFENESTSVDCI